MDQRALVMRLQTPFGGPSCPTDPSAGYWQGLAVEWIKHGAFIDAEMVEFLNLITTTEKLSQELQHKLGELSGVGIPTSTLLALTAYGQKQTKIFNLLYCENMNHIKKIAIATFLFFSLNGCEKSNVEKYQVINKDGEGKISILNQKTGRLMVVSKSNRIDDILELDIKDSDVNNIKNKKVEQDGLLKVRSWGEQKITNTNYKVSLSTRHYKDKLLYSLSFSKADESTSYKVRTISINLRDANGFVLEKIMPTSWVTVVDDEGKPQYEQSSGEIPMTLDNYLEIFSYDPNWGRNI